MANKTTPSVINIQTIFSNLAQYWRNPRSRVVGLFFAFDSFIFASWIAHIPSIKTQLALSDGELGWCLFGLPMGLMLMNPFTGKVINQFGAVRCCWLSAVLFAATILLPIHAPTPVLLFSGLFIAGVATAMINVSMNTCAVYVEKQDEVKIMASCHGMWSLGGMSGASFASLMIALGFSASAHMLGICTLIILIVLGVRPILKTIEDEETADNKKTSFARPNLALVLMVIVGLIVSMAEGLAFDWSAVYLRDGLGASAAVAALAFACFAAAMTICRFSGDMVIARFGDRPLLLGGALMAAFGILVCMLAPNPTVGLLGFFLLGLGCSLGAPILYAASMRIPGIPPAAGLATFASLSMAGFLVGPPLIGLIADEFGLSYGLGFVGVLCLISVGIVGVGKRFF